MTRLLFSSVYILGIFFISFSAHEYHVSITEITYVKDKNRVEIISRLFFDDFQDVLNERYSTNLSLDPTSPSSDLEIYIEKYFYKKLKIEIDGEPKDLQYLGYRFDEDRINIFLKIDEIPNLKEIKLSNLLLTDFFDDQQNIVHGFKEDQKASAMMNRYKYEHVLKFD